MSDERDSERLAEALRSYQQADEDGVMVLVSRQACDEAAAIIASCDAGLAEKERELREVQAELKSYGDARDLIHRAAELIKTSEAHDRAGQIAAALQERDAARAEVERLEEWSKRTVHDFAAAILHGDAKHRNWLINAAQAWVDGRSIPEWRAQNPDSPPRYTEPRPTPATSGEPPTYPVQMVIKGQQPWRDASPPAPADPLPVDAVATNADLVERARAIFRSDQPSGFVWNARLCNEIVAALAAVRDEVVVKAVIAAQRVLITGNRNPHDILDAIRALSNQPQPDTTAPGDA